MSPQRNLLHIAVGWACATALPSVAGEWEKNAEIGLASYYSSNVCLAPAEEEGKEFVTATPRVGLDGSGGRFRASVDAAVEFNSLGESDIECPQGGAGSVIANRETWVPRGSGVLEFDAIEQLLTFEVDGSATQSPINPFAAGGDDNLNATGNTNVIYSWGAGARSEKLWSNGLAYSLRYRYGESFNSANLLLGDSREHRYQGDLGLRRGYARLSGGIRGQYRDVEFDASPLDPTAPEDGVIGNELFRSELYAGLELWRGWSLEGAVGYEDNAFLSSQEELDDYYWDAGIRWNPNQRVDVSAGYGERFFGNTPRASVEYRHKRTTLRASYLRDVQLPQDIRSGVALPTLTGAESGASSGDSLIVESDSTGTFIGNGPIISETFTLSYAFEARRTEIRISASNSKQALVVQGDEAEFNSVRIAFDRDLTRRLDAGVQLRYREAEPTSVGTGLGLFAQALESYSGTARLGFALSDDTRLSLTYRFTDQTSSDRVNTFTEHRVGIAITFSL